MNKSEIILLETVRSVLHYNNYLVNPSACAQNFQDAFATSVWQNKIYLDSASRLICLTPDAYKSCMEKFGSLSITKILGSSRTNGRDVVGEHIHGARLSANQVYIELINREDKDIDSCIEYVFDRLSTCKSCVISLITENSILPQSVTRGPLDYVNIGIDKLFITNNKRGVSIDKLVFQEIESDLTPYY